MMLFQLNWAWAFGSTALLSWESVRKRIEIRTVERFMDAHGWRSWKAWQDDLLLASNDWPIREKIRKWNITIGNVITFLHVISSCKMRRWARLKIVMSNHCLCCRSAPWFSVVIRLLQPTSIHKKRVSPTRNKHAFCQSKEDRWLTTEFQCYFPRNWKDQEEELSSKPPPMQHLGKNEEKWLFVTWFSPLIQHCPL